MKFFRGFTLVEVLVVVTILGVLIAYAVPNYLEQAQRGRRADGKAFIMDISSRLERFYTQYSTYTNVVVGPGGCTGLSCGLNYSVNESSEGLYSAAIALLPAGCSPALGPACTRYTITITPFGDDSKCTTLTLDNTGVEGYTGSATDAQYCWR